MKKIDIENKISSSLESANLPSAHILDAVKQEIREEKTKKRTPINKYALVACVAVIICVLVSLPLVIKAINLNKGNQEITYSSITEYAETMGINIVTFDNIYNNTNDMLPEGTKPSNPPSIGDENTIQQNPYKFQTFEAIDNNGVNIALQEKYLYREKSAVTFTMLLTKENNIISKYYADYSNLDKEISFSSNLAVEYKYLDGVCYAKMDKDGYIYLMKFEDVEIWTAQTQIMMFMDAQK